MADATDNPYVHALWQLRGDDEADHVKAAGAAVASLVSRGQWDRQVEQQMIRICNDVHYDTAAHDWNILIPKFANNTR